MAAVVDPLATLRQALSLAADSPAQASVLASLREYLETVSPSVTILILKNLVPNVQHQTDSLFKQWVFELVWYIVSRLPVNPHDPDRIRFILDVVDPLRELLADQNPFYMKLAIQTLGSVYPQVFRLCCSDPSLHPHWLKMVDVRTRVLDYNTHPTTPLGVRLAVVKFIQRVILVHSKGPSDPRLHNPNDPHLLFVPANHPFFNVAAMDKERISLTEQLLVTFWNGRNPDVSTAVVQAFGSMAKSRPDLIPFVFGAFLGWDPSKLASESVVSVRSIFKAMRIALLHFNRAYPQGRQKGEVEDAIRKLDAKLHDTLAHVEEARRKRTTPTVIAEPAPIVDDSVATRLFQAVNPNILADFDFSTVPSHILAQIVTESLRLIDADLFEASIEKWQESRPIPQTEPAWEEEMEEDVVVKEEPIDPLIMDLEEEDAQVNVVDDMDSDTLVPVPSERGLSTFRLPRPRRMSEKQRGVLVNSCLQRVQSRGEAHSISHQPRAGDLLQKRGKPTPDMWALLMIRMITRGAWSGADLVEDFGSGEDEDDENAQGDGDKTVARSSDEKILEGEYRMRRMLFNYIMSDFSTRSQLASLWLAEEWHNDRLLVKRNPSPRVNFDYWANEFIQVAHNKSDKDSFSQFVLDLPEVPSKLFDLTRELAADKDRMPTAMAILRPIIELRIPLRDQAMSVLLELMTHPSEATRKGAIHTIRRWWPDVEPMASRIRAYTDMSLRRLAKSQQSQSEEMPNGPNGPNGPNEDQAMNDEEEPEALTVVTKPDSSMSLGPYLPPTPTLPADKNEITQYVESSLALSVKDPSFLAPLFETYSQMDVTVQEAVQELLIRPVQAMGPNNPRLLGYLRDYPPGAETLVLKILHVFTENARPTPTILTLVKSLIAERDADARFLMLIIGEMDKLEIVRHLPNLVGTLNGSLERRLLVRQMFNSIVEVPQLTNTNQVREGQSRLLTPKELMIQLHDMETEVGLKKAKEAISVCFNMPETFKSEVLASVMQHYLDAKTLPMLFVWTVLQAVATYKTLTGWVSTTLLSRLITKKVWTNAQLWDGFILCAERTEPNSFDALLQLPKEQLRDLVDRKPAIKVKLREWLTKRAGKQQARYAGIFELLGDNTS